MLVLRYTMDDPKMPTPHRIAPVKHWRSKCCKNIARKAPADPVFLCPYPAKGA